MLKGVVQITFKSKKLQKICNSESELLKKFGKVCARKLRARLDDLYAAPNLESFKLLPGRCHPLKGDRKFQLSLDLEHPLRLIFIPVGEVEYENGVLEWKSVVEIEILGVEDTHD